MAESMDASVQAVIEARMQLEQALSTTADELVRKAAEVKKQRAELDEYLSTVPKLLELNIGGDTGFTISREVFTRIPSQLAKMFSGRWDHMLPKDAEGRFFLDLDPHQMCAIIHWLTELAAVEPGGTLPPHPRDTLAPEHRWGIDELMEHFQLVAPDPKGSAPDAGAAAAWAEHWAALDKNVQASPAGTKEVLSAARGLAAKAHQCALEIARGEEELKAAPHAHDVGRDFVECYCAAFRGEDPIVALNVSGRHMATARATLAAEGGSAALAAQFGPAGWPAQKEQMLKGRVLLEANPASFACVLQYLRLRRLGILGSGSMAQYPPYLPALLDRLGVPAMKPFLVPPEPPATALVASAVLSREQQLVVLSWLPSGARAELLFRASRDGFEAAAFHARCDNRGATLVLALSGGGHRFGGFTDQPWTSPTAWTACTSAFLFRLGSLSGEQPARRAVKPGNPHSIYCHSGCGPTFGQGHALYLQNGTGKGPCNCNFNPGNSYDELVPGGGYILAEAQSVSVTEYEVFRILT